MSQRLVMTPSLQQAIKLLQMSQARARRGGPAGAAREPRARGAAAESPRRAERAPPSAAPEPRARPTSAKDPFDEIDYESYFHDAGSSYVAAPAPTSGARSCRRSRTRWPRPPNLADHLIWQLDLSTPRRDAAQEIGRAIIGNLNEDGYLRATLEEIRADGRARARASDVEQALRLVQTLRPDRRRRARPRRVPVRCSSRTCGEQGDRRPRPIVRYHLDKLQNRRYKELAEALSLDLEDLQAEIEIIRGARSAPGTEVQRPSAAHYVVPDVYVVQDRRRVSDPAQRGRSAAAAHQPGLPAHGRARRAERRRPRPRSTCGTSCARRSG